MIVLTTPAFVNDLNLLRKRYRHIDDDLQPIVKSLEAGEFLGDKLIGLGYDVYDER